MRYHISLPRPAAARVFSGLKALLCGALLLAAQSASLQAQQQQQGLCARVKIVILQELTLERIGFEATLEVTNNDGEDPITDFFASLTFENPLLSTNGIHDAGPLFFVRAPTFENVNSVSGDGVIGPTKKAVVRWFIIPKISAGGQSPEGIRYLVGCNLGGKMRGVEIPKDVMLAIPAQIFVKPEPQLEITYFQPRDVQGDDPFTAEVESPIPFTLGVLVKNSGYGTAHKLKIDSQQPKIVENRQRLLLIAQLLGARVNDSALNTASLVVNLGDILPGQAKKGAWDMITSLSGEFVEFKASYTHASDLGGEETSVIKSLNAYFIAHEVLNDQPGRDAIKDFLADTDNDENMVPDALYESEGNTLPVNWLLNATVVGSAGPGQSFQVTLAADKQSWGYMRLPDPGQAKLPIASVVRSDGKVLNPNNYWTNIRYEKITNNKQTWLNLFDLVDLANYTYTVTYGQVGNDTTPPVTTLHFVGSVSESGGKFYITPDTQMYFLAEDASPVSMFYSLTNGPFRPALPFFIPTPGEYPLVFYATDTFNNREANKTNIIVVAGSGALDFVNVSLPAQLIFVSGDALSIRPFNAPLTFQVLTNPSQTDARIDIFQGVVAWATLAGVPSSPTRNTAATLTVGGDFVDFYRYRLNGAAWSSERAVATPISLSALGAGSYTVEVLGRSQYGGYMDASNAVAASWVVELAAAPVTITSTPATPSRLRSAVLNIAGSGVTAYRWKFNDTFYRAESNAPSALPVPLTASTQQIVTISVIGKTNGVYQPTNNPTTVRWNFDPMFGFVLPGLANVRAVSLTNIGANSQTFIWDGRGGSGTIQPPGWYTVRLAIMDALGRTNFTSRLVQISELSGAASTVADVSRGPKNPYARGHWAVWQDQSDGNFEIYAQDLAISGAPIVRITDTVLNQENPRTDGRYVVWQGRQTNGNWDVFIKDLTTAAPPRPLFSTPNHDEVNPAIDWPWVVYQKKSVINPSAPWLVLATNLLTGQGFAASTTAQDALTPDVQAGRVVWQDQRDVGQGEIYFRNLETGEQRRITTNQFGQYHPAISGNWIAWTDNRNGQVDIYGFDLLRNTEVRITSAPENEMRPYLDGPWLVCQEDSMGSLTENVRLVHLPTLRAVPVTRTITLKDRPALASGRAVWLDTRTNLSSVLVADVPSLQGVFENRNAVAVTEAMVAYQQNAYALLTLWHNQAGVQEITRYSSLVPSVTSETAYWTNGAPAGANFTLTAGAFLWIKFSDPRLLDLGSNNKGALNLAAGPSVFGYVGFPSQFTAFKLLTQLGLNNARGVRMLDSESGRWVVAEVQAGRPVGIDFPIPSVAVLMLDLANPVSNFKPL
ncbi:MAG: hypothetical protein HZA90_20760 [Verrucomicrobia bacterium]|nr:hypothetical protein [Verrucomicrobiota bacterium]